MNFKITVISLIVIFLLQNFLRGGGTNGHNKTGRDKQH